MHSPCPECGSKNLQAGDVLAQGLYFDLLPNIGSLGAKLRSVVCMECGSMRLFVPGIHRRRIEKSKHWRAVEANESEGGGR